MIEQKGIEFYFERDIVNKGYLFLITNRIDENIEEECYFENDHLKIGKRDKSKQDLFSCIKINENLAQGLMDSLFRAGVRPSDEGSPGELRALKYHLEDMRRIAFKKINKSIELEE